MSTHPTSPTSPHDGEDTLRLKGELSEFGDVFRVLDAADAPPLDAAALRRIRLGVHSGISAAALAGAGETTRAADTTRARGATAQPAAPAPAPIWEGLAWASAALTLAASALALALLGIATGGATFAASVTAILAGVALVAIAPPQPLRSLAAGLGGLGALLAVTASTGAAAHHHVGCAIVEVLVVAAPLVAALTRTRLRGDGSVSGVAASAAGAGLSAAGVAGIICPDHSLAHLALIHGGGVLATVAVAAAVAWLVVPARDAARV
jgi:hypothetical protein